MLARFEPVIRNAWIDIEPAVVFSDHQIAQQTDQLRGGPAMRHVAQLQSAVRRVDAFAPGVRAWHRLVIQRPVEHLPGRLKQAEAQHGMGNAQPTVRPQRPFYMPIASALGLEPRLVVRPK